MKRSASVPLGGAARRSRAFLAGGVAAVVALPLAGCDDEPERVDATPVCVVERGETLVVVDHYECEQADADGQYRAEDRDGSTVVIVHSWWYHFPPGSYAKGSTHPKGMTAGRAQPGTVPAGYGKPGSTVKVPGRAGFGGTGAGKAGGGSGG